MTATRDPERILRAWLELMPDEAPDRAVAALLDGIDHTPQFRQPWVVGRWRFPVMPRLVLAAATAALVVILGAIAIAPRSEPQPGGSPAQTAPSLPAAPIGPGTSVAPPASPVAGAPVIDALRHRWISGHRAIPGLPADAGTSLLIDANTVSFAPSNENGRRDLASTASELGGGRLQLVAGDAGPCPTGAVGTYAWELSASGRVLVVWVQSEPCSQRKVAFEGTWNLVGCRDPGTDCLGDLDAGTYVSQYVRPILGPSESWVPKAGAVTYTVPDGWANFTDYPNWLGLTTTTQFAATTPAAWSPPDSIDIRTQVLPEDQSVPCSGKPATGVAATPDAFISYLRTVPGLRVGPSTSTAVGPLAAVSVDLQTDDAKVRPCGGESVVGYMVSGDGQTIGRSTRQRLIITSSSPGSLVAIQIEVADAARFSAFTAAAAPIVQSLRFK